MNTHIANARAAPKRIRRSKDLLVVTAVTFLTLCVWIDPNRTLFFLALIAIGWTWFWLCRRFPLVAWGLMGFIGGLTGSRSYSRTRYRRLALKSAAVDLNHRLQRLKMPGVLEPDGARRPIPRPPDSAPRAFPSR